MSVQSSYSMRLLQPMVILIIFAGLILSCDTTKKAYSDISVPSISTDFDFLLGKWSVRNSVLKERLKDSDDWVEYTAQADVWKIMDGMVIIDEFRTIRGGREETSGSYRIYNENTKEWTIYWSSTAYPDLGLLPQVKGKFGADGKAEFYGEESYKGGTVKIKWAWNDMNTDSPRWEQAYFDEKNNRWEVNWTMVFERL